MRLIDADKLKEKAIPLLFPTKMEPCGHIPIPVQAVVVAEIEQATTIEAEPVRHGRWEKLGEADYRCSECGFRFTSGDPISMFPHCRCGAKMDGDSHD